MIEPSCCVTTTGAPTSAFLSLLASVPRRFDAHPVKIETAAQVANNKADLRTIWFLPHFVTGPVAAHEPLVPVIALITANRVSRSSR